MPGYPGVSPASPLTQTDGSGGRAAFSSGDEIREKPGVFQRSSLGSHKASLDGKASANGELCSVLGKAWEFSED